MSQPIVLKDLAADDLREAIRWYESQRPGLGDELVECVNDALNHISENPYQYPIVHKHVRRALVRRFPFAVFYIEKEDRIVVIAILHGHRHPKLWRKRT